MTIANNPASALERILRKLTASGGQTMSDGWVKTLGATPGTHDFVQRHSEVVNLLAQVHSYLLALPDEQSERGIYLQYVPAWYDAIVFRELWSNAQRPPQNAVRPEILDHLHTLGTIMGMRSPEPMLTDDRLKALTDSLAEWRNLLEETGLEAGLAQEIRRQVDHIEWLLANVETFGVEPVAAGARKLFGLGLPVVAKGGKWKKLVAAAMTGTIMFLTFGETATDKTNNVLTNLSETVQIIEHFGEPQKALPAGQGDGKAIEQGEETRAIEGPQQGDGESPEG